MIYPNPLAQPSPSALFQVKTGSSYVVFAPISYFSKLKKTSQLIASIYAAPQLRSPSFLPILAFLSSTCELLQSVCEADA